jgi:SAM-dependent methyltransferase
MLATRAIADELMDADDLDPETYAHVLRDLAQVNSVTMARRPTLTFLERATQGMTRFRLLDVGFGDGDMLRTIARWAAQRGIGTELIGVDLNPRSLAAAQARTPERLGIDYRIGDYTDQPEAFDFVISSLVAHHMTHDQLIAFLRFMDTRAAKGWLVNDLHRHGFAYMGYPLLARLFGWHRIVRHDGRLSIARSYRPYEWPAILAEAGIEDARIARRFPFRLCVEQVK